MAGLSQAGLIWLDVTRLVTRAGRGVLTGIDRVEMAYLEHLLAFPATHTSFLLRSTRGYLLLDQNGGAVLRDILTGRRALGPADRLSRLIGKGTDPRHRVEASLRAHAIARCLRGGLGRMIGRAAKGPGWYLNIGHTGLSAARLGAFAARPDMRVAVLVHDLIPIIHPDLVAPGMPARFAARLKAVRAHADLVICNSKATADDLARHWSGGDGPPRIVAHLGVDAMPRDDTARDPRHVVMLGTIEPRKNHALMLDTWEVLARAVSPEILPQLHIIGPTGWQVTALMDRIAHHPLLGKAIHLHGPLPEEAVRNHLARAGALVFPSLAEGYGYPPLEAALAGSLPICSDLPVFRETLGNSAVYVPHKDAYSWAETIKKLLLVSDELPSLPPPKAPGWDAHFETVGALLAHP
ncbi:glycosyltransferase [Roseicyclus sp.]|uniref:glycosyltransferase n=1 Tax=Roseicyclus sp. TaxID=1914329 RepID=UPI003F6B42BF